jgi:glycosyltransferase involved in cell wall biosynthesis
VHILHVVHQYFPNHVGGTEHYVRALAQAQQRGGHKVAIFCRESGEGRSLDRESEEGVWIYRATNGPFTPARRFSSTLGDGFLAHSLLEIAAQGRPDVIHVHHLMGLPVNAVTALKPSTPLVVTLHDYWWVCANAQLITNYDQQMCDGPHWWMNCARCGLARAGYGETAALAPAVAPLFALRDRMLRRAMPHVSAWIAPSHFAASWHASHGFDEKLLHVVSHGIALPAADVVERALEARRQKAVHFAYVGGLSPQKGVHILMQAFNRLPKSARLTIAGDESAFPEYCDDLRVDANHPGIQFAGRLERNEVWQLLTDADVVVIPSLWYETSCLVAQEAFTVGTPVIAAEHGALTERVENEVDGLLVPSGDVTELYVAMLRTMYEPELLARLQEGIQPQLGVAEHAHKVGAVYRQAAEHLRRGSSNATGGRRGPGSGRVSDAPGTSLVERITKGRVGRK